jgi:hypothetical protein
MVRATFNFPGLRISASLPEAHHRVVEAMAMAANLL